MAIQCKQTAASRTKLWLSGIAFAGLATVAWSQDYPARPITLVVPFPPGGVADNVARPVAQALGKQLGQAVVIENRQGAGGGIGMAYVAKAKPDGYTLLLALSSISVIPEADRVLGRAPMFQYDQLQPVARFTADPVVLAVRADAPWKSFADFIAFAKANPKKLNYGSSGNYGTMHVPMEMLASNAGISLTHVPFTGAAPAVTALLGGTLDAVASGPSTVVQHVRAGKLRVLANWGAERHPALPDVPTLQELGIPAEYAQWSGLFAPTGTPDAVLAALRKAARDAQDDSSFRQAFVTLQTPLAFLDAPAFRTYWDADLKKMAIVVGRIGKVE